MIHQDNTMKLNTTFSTPHGMVWNHVSCFETLLKELKTETDSNIINQKAALCLHLGILILESFMNIYFRLLVEEDKYSQFKNRILSEIKNRKSIDYKLKKWPSLFFNKKLTFENGIGRDLMKMKEERNSIMHFNYTYETIHLDSVTVNGLADTTFYHSLDYSKAQEYFQTSINAIKEILSFSGISEDKLPFLLQRWTSVIIW